MDTHISQPEAAKPPSGAKPFTKILSGRSLGVKLLLVCALVLLMAIPAGLVSAVSYERAGRADDVRSEVSQRYGGPQSVIGPILVAPYMQYNKDGELTRSGEYVVFPETGSVKASNLMTEEKQRSLYRVTTYKGQIEMNAQFNIASANLRNESGASIDWSQAKIVIGVKHVRGLSGDVIITSGEKSVSPEPGLHFNLKGFDGDEPTYATEYIRKKGVGGIANVSVMSYPASDLSMGDRFDLSVKIPLSGAERLSIVPFAKTSKIALSGDWPHPGFDGHFAPTQSEVTDQGFSAQWYIPYQARGIIGQGDADRVGFTTLNRHAVQLNFIEMVGPYQTVNRALKYSVLFIGLIFLSYFLFEILLGVRVHPAQYVLIGLVQVIFYLLLLSLAEHIGFVLAFLCAALATVGATSAYAGAVFGGRKYAVSAGAVFGSVYALQFLLMQVGDFALMIGSITSFAAVTMTMYLTRSLNWYGEAQTRQ